MASEMLIAGLIFLVSIGLIVSRIVDEVAAALAGVIAMIVFLKSYNVEGAFEHIDWDILAILFGMWVITGYMIEAGLANYVVSKLTLLTRSYRRLIALLALSAGFLSILVDNVIVILVFGTIAAELAKKNRGNPVLAVILIGLSANFMGTALLMGDLPPQLLHGIAGMEFMDFIIWKGIPSSFPLLTLTFLLVLGGYYLIFLKKEPEGAVAEEHVEGKVNKPLLLVSSLFFAATIIGMAIRPRLGVPLGFITVVGAASLGITVEALRIRNRSFPTFSRIIEKVEWRALLFYASLFPLVGGLGAAGILDRAADWLVERISTGPLIGYTYSYWIVALLSTFVEHDALLLTFLYIAKDASYALVYDPHIVYWSMAWSATLASNLTTAAAPALYVAVTIAEKEAGEKITGVQFIKYSAPFVILSLVIHYIVTILLWLPFTS